MWEHTSRAKSNDLFSLASFHRDTSINSTLNDSFIPDISGNACREELLQPLVQATKQALPAHQTVQRHYNLAVIYRFYCRANYSVRYNETQLSYILKMVKKAKLRMRAHLFDPSDSISIIGFLATLKLACDNSSIHEGA